MSRENKLAMRLKRGEVAALSEIMDVYTPYLFAIVSNIFGGVLSDEDAEEVVADTFTALWYNRVNIQDSALKPYIAAIARNKAKSRLRTLHIAEPIPDDIPIIDCELPEEQYIVNELCEIARSAVAALPQPDKEIFQRHYFLYQRTEEIANEMGIKSATVRTKLARGRTKLKSYLSKRGYSYENIFD